MSRHSILPISTTLGAAANAKAYPTARQNGRLYLGVIVSAATCRGTTPDPSIQAQIDGRIRRGRDSGVKPPRGTIMVRFRDENELAKYGLMLNPANPQEAIAMAKQPEQPNRAEKRSR